MLSGPLKKYPVMFGRFRLLGEIGSGGMAVVYRAEMRSLRGFSKIVAVKILHVHLIEDPEQRQLFFNEARLGGFLAHPNIVEIFDFNEQDGRYFLAMEYVNGPTFNQILRGYRAMGHPVPLDVALQLMIQTCYGLDYAHQAVDNNGRLLKMVHRDLKPSNILINPYGQVKIADFGVARAMSNMNLTDTIASGMIKGTIRYLSPEQACSQASLDHRSDLFAAGLILFEFLTNRFFYEGGQQELVLQLAKQADITRPLKMLPQMAFRDRILELLACALAPRQEDRFASGIEMAKAMNKILARLSQRTNLADWLQSIGRLKNGLPEKNARGPNHPAADGKPVKASEIAALAGCELSEATALAPGYMREHFSRSSSPRHFSKPAGEDAGAAQQSVQQPAKVSAAAQPVEKGSAADSCKLVANEKAADSAIAEKKGAALQNLSKAADENDISMNSAAQKLKSSVDDWWNTPSSYRPDYSPSPGQEQEELSKDPEHEDKMTAMWWTIVSVAKIPEQWDTEPGPNTITDLFNAPRHTLYNSAANIFNSQHLLIPDEKGADNSSEEISSHKESDAAQVSGQHFFRDSLLPSKNADALLKALNAAGQQSKTAPLSTSHPQKEILVQDQGGFGFQTGDIPTYVEDLKPGSNKGMGPENFSEMACNADYYKEQGWAAWRKGEYKEAVRQWDKAEAIDPEFGNTSNGKLIKILRERVKAGRNNKA